MDTCSRQHGVLRTHKQGLHIHYDLCPQMALMTWGESMGAWSQPICSRCLHAHGRALQQVCVSVLACPGQHLPCMWLLPATPSPCIHASWSPGPPCQLLAFCCCCCSRCCSVSPSSTLEASAPSIQGSRCRQLRLATGRGIELRMRSTFAAACVLRARSGECRLRRAVTAMLQQLLPCSVAHASMIC